METLNLRLIDLKAFCLVAELGSIAEAARALGETKSSVSRRISRLETVLGCRLFDRTARSSRILTEGTAFYPYIRDAMEKIDDGVAVVTRTATDAAGVVRLTAPLDLSMTLLPEVLNRLSDQYPEISVALRSSDSFLDLAADRIDIALRVTLEDQLPDMDYAANRIGTVTTSLFAPATAPVSRCEEPSQLASFRCLLPSHTPFDSGIELSHPAEPSQTIPIRRDPVAVSDYATLVNFLVVGESFGVLPDVVAQPFVERGQLVPVLPAYSPPGGTLWLVTRTNRQLSTRVQLCKAFLLEALGEAITQVRPPAVTINLDQ